MSESAQQIFESSRPKIKENILFRIEQGRAVLFDVIEGEPYLLNDTATEIWQYFDGQNSLQEIVNRVTKAYHGHVEKIKEDIINFVQVLLEKDFLELC